MADKPGWLKPHGTPWRRGEGRLVFENPWISVSDLSAVAPTGRPASYGLVHFKNFAIAVLPIHEDGTITLVGQNRLPCADYSWEIPEGGGALDVDPLESARRELAEETGLEAAHWRQVLKAQLSNSVTDEIAFGFVATGVSQTASGWHKDETEDLALARVPFGEALQAAIDGHLKDVLTVAMLLRAYHMARERAFPDALARAMLS